MTSPPDRDDSPDHLVPDHVVTGGSVVPSRNVLRLETLLRATTVPSGYNPPSRSREQARIVTLCGHPLSVAEVAAHMQRPVSVVRVLAAALVDRGGLALHAPSDTLSAPDPDLLERLLHGLQNL